MRQGSLTVVGTGIQLAVQLTPEARACLQRAEVVFHLSAEPVTREWLRQILPASRSLDSLYVSGGDRMDTYDAIVEEVLGAVRNGRNVCLAFYGHPGVFVHPSHEAIRRAREEGFEARMLPAISAEDCLFADLGVDPGVMGCQSYEATDFLVNRRRFDTSAALVLWQVTVIGEMHHVLEPNLRAFGVLVDYLLQFYPAGHEVTIYQASPYAVCDSIVNRVALSLAPACELPPLATLFVPPAKRPTPDPEMCKLLGLT